MLWTTQCVQHGGRRYVLGINLEYVMGSRLFQGLGQRKCYTTVCSENQKVNSGFYYRINSVHGSICRVDHFRNSQLDAGTGIFFTTGSITELYSTRWSMVRLNIPLNLVPYNFGIIFGKFSVPLQLADELNAELFASTLNDKSFVSKTSLLFHFGNQVMQASSRKIKHKLISSINSFKRSLYVAFIFCY